MQLVKKLLFGVFPYTTACLLLLPLVKPLPPQCTHWGTFPKGEGKALRAKQQFVVLLIWDGRSFPGKAKTPEQSGVFTKEERKNEKDIEEVFVYIVIGSYEEKKGINIKFL